MCLIEKWSFFQFEWSKNIQLIDDTRVFSCGREVIIVGLKKGAEANGRNPSNRR
jgi:hypothetical protein